MFAGVSTICFSASYAIALGLEISRLWLHGRWRGLATIGVAATGLAAHTAFLCHAATSPAASGAPLSSQRDWFLLAAWGLVVVYLYLAVLHPRWPFGLFLLPLALALIGTARFLADSVPLGRVPASRIWGAIHGVSILLATVAVLLGFVAGLMYLGQTRHLKRKIVSTRGLRLPSLEWLQRVNFRAIVVAVLMLGAGVFSGMVLNRINAHAGSLRLPWSDPVVASTWLTFFWLLAAVVLGAVYRPARQGRKVAYLTLVSFVFLLVMLAAGVLTQSRHWSRAGANGEGRGEQQAILSLDAFRFPIPPPPGGSPC